MIRPMKLIVPALVLILCALPLHADDWEKALTAFEAKQYDTAEKIADAEIVQNPKSLRALTLKGRILSARSQFDAAAETYFKVLEAKPDSYETFKYLGDNSFYDRQWPYALRFYGNYLAKLKGPDAATLLKVVYCKIAMNDFAEAGKLSTYFDPLDKVSPEFYFAKAATLRANGKPDEALKILQQAITLYGQDTYNKYSIDFIHLFKDSTPAPDKKTAKP